MNAVILAFYAGRPGDRSGRLAFGLAISVVLHALTLVCLDRSRPGTVAESPRSLQVEVVRQVKEAAPQVTPPPAPRKTAAPKPAPLATSAAASPGASLLALPGLRYYRSDELSKPARIIVPPDLDNLRLLGMPTGEIDLLIFIDAGGKVDDVQVLAASMPPKWVRYTTDAFRSARFEPGWIDQGAVRSQVRIVTGVRPDIDH